MIQNELKMNELDTTRSAIAPILQGFQTRGWDIRDSSRSGESNKRHEITSPSGHRLLQMNGAKVFGHTLATEKICQRKHLTKRMLNFASLPIPPGGDFSLKEGDVAKAFFSMLPKPIVIKPTNSGGAQGVTVGVSTAEEFDNAWKKAKKDATVDSRILVEEFVQGVELRALVVGERVVSLVARVQPFVLRNGRANLLELVENTIAERDIHYRAKQLGLAVDWDFIARQGHSQESIRELDEIVFLNAFGLPSAGAFLVEILDVAHPQIQNLAVKARQAIPDLEVAGVDLLVKDILQPDTAIILEVNTAPSINLHRYTTHGAMREVTSDIVEYFTRETEN